ncbi:MAG TPA: type II toxin-antitoxin system RelE/ParE family toxin [Burkholderiales bacterium]|nr:type II toxin-antitoxin system RelE/ParE family toxin [Burkholderiales bacterium]
MIHRRLTIRSAAADTIRHLPPDIKRSVKAAIQEITANPACGAPLHGELEGLWKFRVRRFRLVHKVNRSRKEIELVAVGERRSIYEEVAELLRQRR